jgi:ferredoxin
MRYLRGVTTLRLDVQRCTGCGACLEVCPRAVLAADGRNVHIADADACIECGACARNCPVDALTVRAGVGCAAALLGAAVGGGSGACCEG